MVAARTKGRRRGSLRAPRRRSKCGGGRGRNNVALGVDVAPPPHPMGPAPAAPVLPGGARVRHSPRRGRVAAAGGIAVLVDEGQARCRGAGGRHRDRLHPELFPGRRGPQPHLERVRPRPSAGSRPQVLGGAQGAGRKDHQLLGVQMDPDLAARVATARHPEVLLAPLAGRAVEVRPLKQAAEEGMEVVTRLSAWVANATAAGGGKRRATASLCLSPTLAAKASGTKNEKIIKRERDQEERLGRATRSRSRGGGYVKPPCGTYVEPWCNPADFLKGNLYDASVSKSAHALQLARWFAIFGWDNFKVIVTDDMAEDPMGTLEDVLGFFELGLVNLEGNEGLRSRQEWEDIVRNRSNEADPGKKAKLAPQVTPEIVESSRYFLTPHNAALEEFLGVPVPAGWRSR